ncbi:MAG: hypothetical protein GWO04_47115, partial [Actinobacteria bacterium]|nr:hypothetical protein [Actinomycetota bacterium]
MPEAEGFVDLSSVRVASDATGSTLRITHTVAARVEDRCGNGVIDPGEECDDGPANGTGQGCSAECKTIVSDEFDGPTIDTDVWTIVDPL